MIRTYHIPMKGIREAVGLTRSRLPDPSGATVAISYVASTGTVLAAYVPPNACAYYWPNLTRITVTDQPLTMQWLADEIRRKHHMYVHKGPR